MKKRVLIGHFTAESNENVPGLTELNDFTLKFEQELLDAMYVKPQFDEANIELIPSIFASAVACKLISKEAFNYIKDVFIRDVSKYASELDGIYLFLHGASKVESLEGGSGERYLLKEIRKVVGPYIPIAIVMDPHGNLTEEYVSMMTIGRSYRESPHTDIKETYQIVADMLINQLTERKRIQPLYRKLPFLLGGEKSVSTDEPMRSINHLLDEVERDERILSTSFHVGYLRHDNFSAGTGLIVIPSDESFKRYGEEILSQLEQFVLSKIEDFHYHGMALEEKKAIDLSIEDTSQHIVVTDSGDNVTSGAQGANTRLLHQYVAKSEKGLEKKVLLAGIYDPEAFSYAKSKQVGDSFDISIGLDRDLNDKKIELRCQLVRIGRLQQIFGDTTSWGETLTLRVAQSPVDIVLLNKSVSLAENHQFEAANIDLEDYNIVVVKQGYVFPDLKEYADLSIMALTDGQTNQKIETLSFKQIKRPMYPFDALGTIQEGK